jgi:hypothetical protein
VPEVDCENLAPDVNPAMHPEAVHYHLMQHFFCRDIVIVRSSPGGRPLIMLMSYGGVFCSREPDTIFVSGDQPGTFYVSHRSGGGTGRLDDTSRVHKPLIL